MHYKLIYFDVTNRGEVIRMLLHLAGVPFIDERVSKESWPELKPGMPFGQVPVLEVDGKLLAQSHAIARFVAKRHGLVGKDVWESALCDQFVDATVDLLQYYRSLRRAKSDAEREEAKKTLLETALPAFCKRIIAVIEANPAGWLVGDQLTWADVYVAHALDILEAAAENCLALYPEMKEFQQRVLGQPNLKDYLAKRGPLPKV